MNLRYITSALLAFALIGGMFSLQSCGPEFELAEFRMEIQFTPEGQTYEVGETYMINGTAVEFTLLRFYLSGIGLRNAQGQTVRSNAYLLAKPGQTVYEAGQVISDSYVGLTFDVGIDSAVNHTDPSSYVQESVLAPQIPEMHWAWDPGYKFMKIEGLFDSDGDGSPDTGFNIHWGLDKYLANVLLDTQVGKEGDEDIDVAIAFDPVKLYDSIDFPTENTSHANNPAIDGQILENIPKAFSIVN